MEDRRWGTFAFAPPVVLLSLLRDERHHPVDLLLGGDPHRHEADPEVVLRVLVEELQQLRAPADLQEGGQTGGGQNRRTEDRGSASRSGWRIRMSRRNRRSRTNIKSPVYKERSRMNRTRRIKTLIRSMRSYSMRTDLE